MVGYFAIIGTFALYCVAVAILAHITNDREAREVARLAERDELAPRRLAQKETA